MGSSSSEPSWRFSDLSGSLFSRSDIVSTVLDEGPKLSDKETL